MGHAGGTLELAIPRLRNGSSVLELRRRSEQALVLKHAIGTVLGVPWQRCTVHVLRDMLGHVQRAQQQMVGAAIRQVFAAPTREEARAILTDVVARLTRVAPKSGTAATSDAVAGSLVRRRRKARVRQSLGRTGQG